MRVLPHARTPPGCLTFLGLSGFTVESALCCSDGWGRAARSSSEASAMSCTSPPAPAAAANTSPTDSAVTWTGVEMLH